MRHHPNANHGYNKHSGYGFSLYRSFVVLENVTMIRQSQPWLRKTAVMVALLATLMSAVPATWAEGNSDPPHTGKITGKSVAAGCCHSLSGPVLAKPLTTTRAAKWQLTPC
jgi:hypothetical protein